MLGVERSMGCTPQITPNQAKQTEIPNRAKKLKLILKGIDIMMKEKKVTKRERFAQLLNIPAVAENVELKAFVEHEIELLAKKNASGDSKPTAVQIANAKVKEEILECMANEPDRMFTISEMLKAFPCCAEMTNQRVSALVRQLKEDGKVVRFEEKRKAYFKIA